MRRPGGYGVIVDPSAAPVEFDTFTCCHCNAVVRVEPRQDPATMGGFCRLCMDHVCRKCVDGPCTPFLRRVEAVEARGRFLKAIGLEDDPARYQKALDEAGEMLTPGGAKR